MSRMKDTEIVNGYQIEFTSSRWGCVATVPELNIWVDGITREEALRRAKVRINASPGTSSRRWWKKPIPPDHAIVLRHAPRLKRLARRG
ncbi:MAG TPA: hypothetical protein VJH24_03595 [Candidatus Bilamarchaeaceae archaeon]|nr:hypothetical protein [Candidatus Bilamarchaeaceae archaeon]